MNCISFIYKLDYSNEIATLNINGYISIISCVSYIFYSYIHY